MSLRYKIFLVVTITLFSLISTFSIFSRNIILEDFKKLEAQNTLDNLIRVQNALRGFQDNLISKSSDWATWDDSYKFIQDHNSGFIVSNMANPSVINLKIDLMAFVDLQGRVVHNKALDLDSQTEIAFPNDMISYLVKHKLLFVENDARQSASGIILLDDKLLMVAVRPLLKSDGTGPIRGSLIFGKFITQNVLDQISDMTHLQVEAHLLDHLPSHLGPAFLELGKILENKKFIIEPISQNVILSYVLVRDMINQPTFILSASMPRLIYKRGMHTIHYLSAALLITGFILLIVLLFFLEGSLVRRITTLDYEVTTIEKSRRFSAQVNVSGSDEVGSLSTSINAMLASLDRSMQEALSLNDELKKAERQLLQAQKMESIGQLAAGISHDFNNLLGVIIGYVDLLKDEFKNNAKASKKLWAIQKSAERGAVLTRELLGYARKGKYEKRAINLNALIKETLSLLLGSLNKKYVFQTCLESKLWPVEGDATQIMQVFMNLAINASHAMPEGGVITFHSENLVYENVSGKNLASGQYVHVKISDVGTGIPQDVLLKIFDPFFTTKPNEVGAGLGLSMVAGIMKSHGGSIYVDSKVGEGTIIHLYFPKSSMNVQSDVLEVKIDYENKIKSDISVVLIAEDEVFLREYYQDYFQKKFPATKVLIAIDGEDAVLLFHKHQHEIDLILLDVIMPKMDGIKAYQEMKRVESKLKVVFVSGYSESESIAKLRAEEGVGYVQKPIDTKLLQEEIERVLKDC